MAIKRARDRHPGARFVRADVRALPFADAVFASALDRGCFHYVDAKERPRYVDELARVLLPGGRLLLRACTSSEGHPNGVDKAVVRRAFDGWIVARIETRMMSSDIREMPAVVARLEHP